MSTKPDQPWQQTTPKDRPSILYAVFFVVTWGTLYAYASLSKKPVVFPAIILLFAVLEFFHAARIYKEPTPMHLACELAYFAVLFSISIGVYRNSLPSGWLIVFATIFYRPFFTTYRNLRIAFALGLVIAFLVLPLAWGLVKNPEMVLLLSIGYAASVAALWLFCSKLSSRVFG